MANEVTATSLTNIINSEYIEPMFSDYARPWIVATKFCRMLDLRGKASGTYVVPRISSSLGTPSDGGASVDTEFNATEGTDLSNTAMTTTQATVTTSEYGVLRTLTDTASEDVVDGFQLLQEIGVDNARILTTALEDDVCALFSSLANSSGSTGVDMTLANLDSAIIGIRTRGVRATRLVAVLDDEQAANFESAVTATGSSTAVYDGASRDYLAIQRDAANGMGDGRFAQYKGVDLYMTGLTDTANTGADVVGAVFVPGDPENSMLATFGLATSRELNMEIERNASLRSTEIVTTSRKGVAELLDVAGTAIITDAP